MYTSKTSDLMPNFLTDYTTRPQDFVVPIIWRGMQDVPENTNWLRHHKYTFAEPAYLFQRGYVGLPSDPTFRLEAFEPVPKNIFNTRYEPYKDQCLHPKLVSLLRHSIKAIEYQIKDRQTLVLTGRDTWYLYVLACKSRKLRDRVVFIPAINRTTSSRNRETILNWLESHGIDFNDPEKFLWADTGFVGSVFLNLTKRPEELEKLTLPHTNFKLMSISSSSKCSALLRDNKVESGNRYYALRELIYKLEDMHSYWEEGHYNFNSPMCLSLGILEIFAITSNLWKGIRW